MATSKDTTQVTAVLPNDLVTQLDAYAEQEDRSRSQVIAIAVRQFLASQGKAGVSK